MQPETDGLAAFAWVYDPVIRTDGSRPRAAQQLLLLLNKKESKGRDNRHSGSGGVDIGSGPRPEN